MELYEWQKLDEENGLCMLWLTHDCLDEIKKMDLSDKTIWMFGAGFGDAWLAKRCKKLYVVERNDEWLAKSAQICAENQVANIEYIYRPCNDSSGAQDMYCEIPEGIDVIINDDAYRTEVVMKAIEYFKDKGGILISDNWWQDFVWKSEKAVWALEKFEHKIFPQKDHSNHEGNCWKTAIHYIT